MEVYKKGIEKVSELTAEDFSPSKKEFSDSFVELTESMIGNFFLLKFLKETGSSQKVITLTIHLAQLKNPKN